MIALIDYGSGNLRSVHKALLKAGGEVALARTAQSLAEAEAVVLPGVGAFDDCLAALRSQGLLEICRQFISSGKPFLGICVGYQALFENSSEFDSKEPGMGVFKGRVIRFSTQPNLKVPQIGWNQLEIAEPSCPLYEGVSSGSSVYFVHSYFPEPVDDSIVATRTYYGQGFASSVWKDNIYGTQFHPEKSQRVGLRILENFVKLAGS